MSLVSNGQTLYGSITNIEGEKIPFANVTVKDSLKGKIKEFVIAKDGQYFIKLKNSYRSIFIEVTSLKYQKEVFLIEFPEKEKEYKHSVVLAKDTIVVMENIVINSKPRPFVVSNDTVSYNVGSYREASDNKIEDIIKKLPGVLLDEKSGEISYKGIPVETVQLDGEDLFGSNYSIGTKNINVDMVEQVQAIENYSSNPLLKDVEVSDKVALNLVLKKKKTDFSGNTDIGLGLIETKAAADVSLTLLEVSKKVKSFATASFNNIGKNNSPFDYFSYTPGVEQLKEDFYLAKKYIPEFYFNSEIDKKRSNINQSYFGSYNSVFKLGKSVSVKTILYYLKDHIISNQNEESTYFTPDEYINTSDLISINKYPNQYRGEFEVKVNSSKNSLFVYSLKYRAENINTDLNILQNKTVNFNNNQTSKDKFVFHTITYTNKISKNKAIQFVARHSINNVPQNLNFLPAIFEPGIYSTNDQRSSFDKRIIQFQANLLSKNNINSYNVAVGGDCQIINYKSSLMGNNSAIKEFNNSFKYNQQSIYVLINYKFKINKFGFSPSLSLNNITNGFYEYIEASNIKKSHTFIAPSFSINYKINDQSAITLSSAVDQKSFSEENLIANPVFVSARLIKLNEVSLELKKSKNFSLFYVANNIFKQYSLSTGIFYSENKGNYYSRLFIKEKLTQNENFFLPEINKFYSANFFFEKYINPLKGKFQIKNNYFIQQYKNIINNSSLRTNLMTGIIFEIFYRSAFKGKINFENSIELQTSQIKSTAGRTSYKSLNDKFKLKYRHSKTFSMVMSADYFVPNTFFRSDKYIFMDAEMKYFITKKYSFSIIAKNILNHKNINQISISDYYNSSTQTSLLPAYLLLKISTGL